MAGQLVSEQTWLELHDAPLFDVGAFPEAVPLLGIAQALPLLRQTYPDHAVALHPHHDGREDERVIGLMVRQELLERDIEPVRIGGRFALKASLVGGTDVLSAYYDETSKELRSQQARDTADVLGENAILLCGQNDTDEHGFWPTAIRMAGPFVRRLPPIPPSREMATRSQYEPRRLLSQAQRLSTMIDGVALSELKASGFRNAARMPIATKQAGPVGLEIDRIMYRGNVRLQIPTIVTDSQVSDHRRLRAGFVIPR